MKPALFVIVAVVGLSVVSSCGLLPYSGPDPDYHLTMYISLGLYSAYPDDSAYDGGTIEGLANYGGKTVFYEVSGIDGSLNESVQIIASSQMGWTGGDQSSSTQFASYTADISENTMYLAGTYRFRMFIDWDDSGALSSGDVVFDGYNVYADTDDDPDTQSLLVAEADYGSAIVYNESDYSVDILDPLSTDKGLPWVITAMDAGPLVVYP